ncbi:hypothetical protein JMJ35_006434 [Cladonia borealis]|uniref:Uncharacterized protein n=1 Tax=Cladonia borealis TaxID=184061 RepID=A0AA39V0G0_9LECA|nr:hypothetical protein JMJ35_006434 [Cladonia borealis]
MLTQYSIYHHIAILQYCNTWAFNRYIGTAGTGETSVQDAQSMLQLILCAFQPRKVMASELELPNGQQVRATALTPLYKIMTLEIAIIKLQADHY